ncbi:mCG1027184, partial [Mus musculus]
PQGKLSPTPRNHQLSICPELVMGLSAPLPSFPEACICISTKDMTTLYFLLQTFLWFVFSPVTLLNQYAHKRHNFCLRPQI